MTGHAPSFAKITRPSQPGVLPRKRLFALLDQRRSSSVVWVMGPAGSGKTTLVSSYLDARDIDCLWYQVDQGTPTSPPFSTTSDGSFERTRRPAIGRWLAGPRSMSASCRLSRVGTFASSLRA